MSSADNSEPADTGGKTEESSRREFLKGQLLAKAVQKNAIQAYDATTAGAVEPQGGDTIGLSQRAMACDFSVILNPGQQDDIEYASHALDLLVELEQQMSVYRPTSELSRLNAAAAEAPVSVEPRLYKLLRRACELAKESGAAFDPTAGPLVQLWRECREQSRIPESSEIAQWQQLVGCEHVQFNDQDLSIQFAKPGIELNLGGIGKGFALDQCADVLMGNDVSSFLIHGGRSSLLARGDHNNLGGWPVGIGNPLLTNQRMGTILLKDRAMSTSGSNVQHFRLEGKRFGHILDPRTGWPVDHLLSVTVLAETAADADALSTAFFVLGVENALRWCDNHPQIGAVLVPFPTAGRRVQPVIANLNSEILFWNADQVDTNPV